MNKILLFIIISFSFLSLSGCTGDDVTPPPSAFIDRTMTDYSFIDVSSNCELHTNVSPTNESSPCSENKSILSVFYSDEYNWSIMCCEFDEQCYEISTNVSDYDLICNSKNISLYTGYVFNDEGFWMAQCCNNDGNNCYVDLSVDPSDNSSVCDEQYHINTYGTYFNGSVWSAMCCIGGLEE